MTATSRSKWPIALVIVLLIGLGAWWWMRPAPVIPGEREVVATTPAAPVPLPGSPIATALPDLRLANRATISGTVFDPQGQPLAGAQVCASVASERLPQREAWKPTCALSERDGHYRLEGLWPVRTRLTASAPRYAPVTYSHGEGVSRRNAIELRPAMVAKNIDLKLEDGGVEITGIVRDLSGGPVDGAQVIGEVAFAKTDAEGRFSMWVRPGEQTLVADAEGYAPGRTEGLAPGHHFELALTPEAILIGKVVRVGTGAVVEGATVIAGGQGWGGGTQSVTDANGEFRITGLEPGAYKPRAESDDGIGKAAEQVILGLGETSAAITIETHPAFFVAARVIGEGGSGHDDCYISLRDRSNARNGSGGSEADGDVRIQGLLPGTYEVTVSCIGQLPEASYEPIVITDHSVSEVIWKVSRGRTIRGEVVDADGKPVPNVDVQSVGKLGPDQARGRTVFGRGDTDAHGRFEVGGLLAGRYELNVYGKNRERPEQPTEVTVAEGHDLEGVRIELPATGQVRGSVLDARGRPIAKSRVVLQGGPQVFSTPVADDGNFSIAHVPAGSYRAVAEGDQGELRAPSASDDDIHGENIEVRVGKVETIKLVVEAADGVITGVVRDGDGGPVADAFIESEREPESAAAAPGAAMRSGRWSSLHSPHLTDADGRFTLTALRPGKHTLRAHRKGGGEAIVEHVELGGDITLTIAATSRLSGTVVMPGGPPPDEFSLQLSQKATGFSRRDTFFRTGGAWSLPDIPPGEFKLRINAGPATAELDVSVREGEDTLDLRIELAPKISVRGTVVDLEGNPVPGVQVFIRPRGGGGLGSSGDAGKLHVTDPAGRFELTGVPTGTVQVAIIPQDDNGEFVGASFPAEIAATTPSVELPPIRMPRKRIKPGEVDGDLGYKLAAPDAAADPSATRLTVAVVRPGGPAEAAGLQVGDEVVRVDGQDVTGSNAYLSRSLTNVPAGTIVTLGLARGVDIAITAGAPP